jgi:hypothetical protein
VGGTTEYFASITLHYGIANYGKSHTFYLPYYAGSPGAPPPVTNYYAPPF